MKKKQKNKLLFWIICILVIILGITFLVKLFYVPTKTYHSKFLKITFNYPAKFKLEEKFTNIVLENSEGKIIISRTGTNFEKLNDHINTLSRLNRFIIADKQEFTINDYPAIKGLIEDKKYYWIYPTAWTVFSLSATSTNLYPDLDKIAQSFRHEP